MPRTAPGACTRVLCLALLSITSLAAPQAGQQGTEERAPVLTGLDQTRLLPPELAQAEDLTGSGLAFVELESTRDTYLLGEPFDLRLRFGFEPELLRAHLVQLFQRPLDVPAQVFAPALEALDGALFLDSGEPQAGASFALGETITRARRAPDLQRGGRTYAVFEFERRGVATRAGELVLEAPLLRFARATRFEDDFVHGRLPLDRSDGLVRGEGARLVILPLPEEGRPAEFTGAIGRFTIEAAAEPRELAAGESLELSVRIEAAGSLADLSRCEAPRLEGLPGFHVRGSLLEREALRLTARYDIVPLGPEVTAVPPIRFASFDTAPPAGYRSIETPPIPIVVHPADERASPPPPEAARSEEKNARPLARAGALLAALSFVFVLWLRRRRRQKPAR